MLIAIVAALAAAGSFAAGGVLQQRAASTRPEKEALSFRLVLDLLHEPMWLLGMGFAFLSYVLEGIALSFGPLVLVQPLIVTELLFALPISVRWRGMTMGWREWTGTVSVAGGLTVGLVSAAPGAGRPEAPIGEWALALAIVGAMTLLAVSGGRRYRGPGRSSLYALGAATVLGAQAALFKAAVARFQNGIAAGFGSWRRGRCSRRRSSASCSSRAPTRRARSRPACRCSTPSTRRSRSPSASSCSTSTSARGRGSQGWPPGSPCSSPASRSWTPHRSSRTSNGWRASSAAPPLRPDPSGAGSWSATRVEGRYQDAGRPGFVEPSDRRGARRRVRGVGAPRGARVGSDALERLGQRLEGLEALGLRRLDHQRLVDHEGEVHGGRVEALFEEPLGDVQGAEAVAALQAGGREDDLVHARPVEGHVVDVREADPQPIGVQHRTFGDPPEAVAAVHPDVGECPREHERVAVPGVDTPDRARRGVPAELRPVARRAPRRAARAAPAGIALAHALEPDGARPREEVREPGGDRDRAGARTTAAVRRRERLVEGR